MAAVPFDYGFRSAKMEIIIMTTYSDLNVNVLTKQETHSKSLQPLTFLQWVRTLLLPGPAAFHIFTANPSCIASEPRISTAGITTYDFRGRLREYSARAIQCLRIGYESFDLS